MHTLQICLYKQRKHVHFSDHSDFKGKNRLRVSKIEFLQSSLFAHQNDEISVTNVTFMTLIRLDLIIRLCVYIHAHTHTNYSGPYLIKTVPLSIFPTSNRHTILSHFTKHSDQKVHLTKFGHFVVLKSLVRMNANNKMLRVCMSQ